MQIQRACEIYGTTMHFQPLPLLDPTTLAQDWSHFPECLCQSLVAAAMIHIDTSDPIETRMQTIRSSYTSARNTTLSLVLNGKMSVQLIQALCLLSLVILAGKMGLTRILIYY